MDNQEFWNNIEIWTDSTIQHAVFYDTTLLYKEMYEECKKYNKWTHIFSKDFSKELIYNLDTLSGTLPEPWVGTTRAEGAGWQNRNYGLQEKWKKVYDNSWEYYHTVPKEKNFPTVIQFLKDNPQYINPVISKLGANEKILVHKHHHHKDAKPQFLYNMAINEPEGCKFAIYPTGLIPYNAGDIYKLYVNYEHSVINGNKDRFHLLLRHNERYENIDD